MIHSKYTNKNNFKLIALFITSLLVFSCSNDDDGIVDGNDNDNEIIVQELINITVEENLQSGESIGAINASSNSPITYTILEQDFSNAIVIDANTGALTVGDASYFNFEINPIILAIVEITNGTVTVSTNLRVNLTNKDDIAFYLSDSKQDYNAAQPGEWITVTEDEYNALALNLQDVAKVATNDGDYNNTTLPSTISNSAADTTIANNNGETMPTGSYLFAFKYVSGGVATSMRAKQSSTEAASGYENIGNTFPMGPVNGTHYLVLKGSNVATTDIGFLAMYSPIKSFRSYPPAINQRGIGDTNTLSDVSSNNLFLYQGLSTTQIQWE